MTEMNMKEMIGLMPKHTYLKQQSDFQILKQRLSRLGISSSPDGDIHSRLAGLCIAP